MFLPILILGFSAWLLVWSADLLIKQTRELAYRLKLSKLFIALVLVALGTSLPELTVSSVALAADDPGLAIGGIIGSNITNVTLILGIGIAMNHMLIGRFKTQQNAWLLLIVTALFIILFWLDIPVTAVGSMLIGAAIGVLIWQYVKAVQGRENEDKLFFVHVPMAHAPWWRVVGLTLVGLAFLMVSGSMLVWGTQQLAEILGISTTVLGLTLVALATSLPELVSMIIAQRQHEDKIAIGNILGSNIYNLAFIGGVMSFNLPYSITLGVQSGILALSSIVLFSIIKWWRGQHVPKLMGIGLVLGYVMYLVGTLIF